MKLSKKEIDGLDKYFRLLNYMSVGMLYLKSNPILKDELTINDIKKKLVGHWGSAPGQNFIYTHLNRVIRNNDLEMIYISGPGHSGQVMIANSYIEGSYTDVYPTVTRDLKGLTKLFKTFSFPGGTSSHASPGVPGSINEGGELGYSLSHAFGAVIDNPNLIAACVIGDGEAETGPLANSWHGNKFINPKKDGIVLPILHLNGYKIANPTVFARISTEERLEYFRGCGYEPIEVDVRDRDDYHTLMANAMDLAIKRIKKIKSDCKNNKEFNRPMYPMIILISKKGWTGPIKVDGKEVEGTFRSHQIPISFQENINSDLILLNNWLKSYKPNELFNDDGTIKEDILDLVPNENLCMTRRLETNGGLLLKTLKVPNYKDYKVNTICGITKSEDMRILGNYIRDIMKLNKKNFRVFGPDEALSNRLNSIFSYTSRKWNTDLLNNDEYLSNNGYVYDSYLSETFCEGLLEGYLLTGRYGFIHSYEAFIRIIDSMVSQHAKWLKECKELPWRKSIASLNIILTSHVWQQDHNGYTHQNPGFLNHIVNYKSDIVRMYFPIDANTLLSTFDHIIKTKDYINVVVASKHKSLQWMTMKEASNHCKKGLGVLEFASNKPNKPDIVLASCGDTPNLEIIAASLILKRMVPKLKTRVVNVIDLMRLESNINHPHGLTDKEFDDIFTRDLPVIFAFHGYPVLIHQLVYKRHNQNFHVHGYIEEGTITTPFDMRVQNKIDRFNLVIDALSYVDQTKEVLECIEYCYMELKKHKKYIKEHGIDMNEILDFSL